MTGREKPKRKALHRGLDDIVNRDASLTSKLLGRVKPPAREPLNVPLAGSDEPASETQGGELAPHGEGHTTEAPQPRARVQPSPVLVRRIDAARAGAGATALEPERGRESAAAAPPSAVTFEEFVDRWGFILKSGGRVGKLRICEVLFNNTHAVGRETFLTSYDKLARMAGLEKKQCGINVKQLESLGFVERLNIYNTATRQGTEFKLHLEQLPPHARRAPRHYIYDEEVSPED